MVRLLPAVLDRLRPREGWAPFLLASTALLCPPASLGAARSGSDAAGDGLSSAGLIVLTILATVLGLRVARSRLSARSAAILGSLLGAVLAIVAVGRLLPPLTLLWQETVHAAHWFQDWRQALIGWPLPFAPVALWVWQQLQTLGLRLWWWAQALASGVQAQDRVMLLLLSAFLAWIGALFATWQIYRRHSAWIGLAPAGVAMAILAFFRGGMAFFFLIVYLLCTLGLVAACRLWRDRQRWEESHTDYPGELGLELTFSLAPWLVAILLLAALFPPIHINPVREAFWRWMDGPWSRVERVAERFFGPIESGYPTAARGGVAGELPRSHLLGAGPELSETRVLYVSTNDPLPPPPEPEPHSPSEPATPRRYWRSQTFDVYTGLGWAQSAVESRPVSPDQPLESAPPPGQDLIQQFQRLTPGDSFIYAVNAPYRLDHPMEAWWRAPGDLVQLTGAGDLYTAYSVLSRAPAPTIAELRAHSPLTATLPADLTARYLSLPEGLPRRVRDLAREVVGDAPTRYDQARALEQYLRAYPYTLDLPTPPTDRDLVDYFLFDLQEGYCDYYASAMVVMARAVGIPARLATGYAQGTYDYDRRQWVVAEKDGHSWVEVYFEAIGWVEFEPTASQPLPSRPGGEGMASLTVPPLPSRAARWWQQIPWALVGLGGILLLLLSGIVWLWHPRSAVTPDDLVRDRQARLLRWGARLGHPLRDGQTAYEYSQALGQSLRTRGQDSPLPQARRASAEAPAEIDRLAEVFAHAQYSPQPISDREGWQVRDLWSRLRQHLLWMTLAKRSKK
jgi:transglutaminase-like putative cysteine protease